MIKVADEMDQGAMEEREGRYLTFTLDKVEYGIGISKISEIIGMIPATSVPRTPDFVKGVINLRGKVIPVVDLRLRVGMEEIEYTERTCIIVVEIAGRAGPVMIGIVVDAVSEVFTIKGEDIEDTPTFGTKLSTEFILGMAKMGGGVKILLDIDRVLSQKELELVSRVEREDSRLQVEAKPKKTAAAEAPREQTVPAPKQAKGSHTKGKGERGNREEKSRKTKGSRGQSKRKKRGDKDTATIDIQKCRLSMQVLDFLPTPVMAVDREFNVLFMNPAGARAVGKSAEACVGQKCCNLLNMEHCNTPDCQVAKAMQQDGVFTSETRANLPSAELPIRYTGAPLEDDKGNIVGGLELVLDISKAMEVTEGMMDLARSS